MAEIPQTSVSLLQAISSDTASARWGEFYRVYGALMRDYALARFPSLDPDDLVQEAMVALAARLPNYRYVPDERGHFRNYVMGVVKYKALDALRARNRESAARQGIRPVDQETSYVPQPGEAEERIWREAVMETALQQLMADTGIAARTRLVFQRVALNHEPPEIVAKDLGLTRNNVDQIKSRLVERLQKLVETLARED